MIRMKRLNEVREAASEERAARLEQQGFTWLGGAAGPGSRPVTQADLEKPGEALPGRVRAETKNSRKGGKPREEPDGTGTGEPDSGDGEK